MVESPENVPHGLIKVVAAAVIREMVSQGRPCQLQLEFVALIQEQDNLGPRKPSGIDNRVEYGQILHHPIRVQLLEEYPVILVKVNHKHDRRDVFKHVDPFFPLRPFAVGIIYSYAELTH